MKLLIVSSSSAMRLLCAKWFRDEAEAEGARCACVPQTHLARNLDDLHRYDAVIVDDAVLVDEPWEFVRARFIARQIPFVVIDFDGDADHEATIDFVLRRGPTLPGTVRQVVRAIQQKRQWGPTAVGPRKKA